MRLSIYRYDPDQDCAPYMQDYDVEPEDSDKMLLDLLLRIKSTDESLSFRRSCREGICGSDAMNINGRNGLACITPINELREPIELRPMPGFPVVRDLIVDMEQFLAHFRSVRPYLVNNDPPPERERLQTPEQRAALDGLWECILCGCCSGFCPSYWWNPDKFLGPAALLHSYRFIADSRDTTTAERLAFLDDVYRLYRCRSIMNCTEVCPKQLSPSRAIEHIRINVLKSSM
ncbi:succinate dehydrogenase iron-sulfur subunit [Thioalkalivibrio thiocyanodenitrificans]|uniref:succinate dehydrogenase iron-sulfur subunit n=1 Tax=Thioalkalivibrio thiocyanodenitrificans TaxID=243063 RepID=UPI00035F13E7|nr:succinate dehydrogenase iron-sulfur subunit [Thioalkalivibrio thiocyanodenitrificans]